MCYIDCVVVFLTLGKAAGLFNISSANLLTQISF